MEIIVDSVDQAWRELVTALCERGQRVSSRNGDALEMIGAHAIIKRPWENLVTCRARKLDPTYACAELLWYLSGSNDGRMISAYAPQYSKFLEDDGGAYGAYGPRLAGFFPTARFSEPPRSWRGVFSSSNSLVATATELLRANEDTRQAVIPIICSSDLQVMRRSVATGTTRPRDFPCTIALHLMIRDGALMMLVMMRSNDAWLGFPYDAFCFTSLQRIVASLLGTRVGEYHHWATSMHLYERDARKVAARLGVIHECGDNTAEPPPGDSLLSLKDVERSALNASFLESAARVGTRSMTSTTMRSFLDADRPHAVIRDALLAVTVRWALHYIDDDHARSKDIAAALNEMTGQRLAELTLEWCVAQRAKKTCLREGLVPDQRRQIKERS